MSKNYGQPGEQVTFTAPTGGVVAGTAYLIGTLLVVAISSVAQALPFAGSTEGIWDLPKAATITPAEGALVYWDNAAKNVTTTATGNTRIGVCMVVPGASDATIRVRLNGCAAPTGA